MGKQNLEQLAALQGAKLLTGNAFGSADMVQQQGLLTPPTPQAPMEAMMADGSMGRTLESGGMTHNPMTGGYDLLNPFQRMGQGLGSAFDAMGGMSKEMGGMGMHNGLMPGEWDEWEKQNPMNLLALLQRRRFGG